MIENKIIKQGPRSSKKAVYTPDETSGVKALMKEEILNEYSIAKQINTIREAILTGNLTELSKQHSFIQECTRGKKSLEIKKKS